MRIEKSLKLTVVFFGLILLTYLFSLVRALPEEERALTDTSADTTSTQSDNVDAERRAASILAGTQAVRERALRADSVLLDKLRDKADYTSEAVTPRDAYQRQQFVSTYQAQLEETLSVIGPEGKALREDIQRKLEDEDLQLAE